MLRYQLPHEALPLLHNMFALPIPLLEKILRPIIMYLVLIALLRLFGKRELAQLNPFDLVVLLMLSNTVQNAIIGDDNSVSGGIIGAISLLSVNWLLSKATYRAPRLNAALQGQPTTLIADGKIVEKALKDECMTHEELSEVLHRNNHNHPEEIELCRLDPNGTFYVRGFKESQDDQANEVMLKRLDELLLQVQLLRQSMAGRQ